MFSLVLTPGAARMSLLSVDRPFVGRMSHDCSSVNEE